MHLLHFVKQLFTQSERHNISLVKGQYFLNEFLDLNSKRDHFPLQLVEVFVDPGVLDVNIRCDYELVKLLPQLKGIVEQVVHLEELEDFFQFNDPLIVSEVILFLVLC